MTARDIAGSALRNLRRRKIRTVLTTIGVWVGILTMVTMVSLGTGLQAQVTGLLQGWGLETVWVNPATPEGAYADAGPSGRVIPARPIRPADLAALRALPGVVSVESYVRMPGRLASSLLLDGRAYTLPLTGPGGGNPDIFLRPEFQVLAGHDLDRTEQGRGLLLSQAFLRAHNLAAGEEAALVGRQVTLHVDGPRGASADFPVSVVGVNTALRGAEVGTADMAAITAWWYNAPDVLQTGGYDPVVIHTASVPAATAVSARVTALGFQPLNFTQFTDEVNRLFLVFQVLLSSIGLLALLIAAFGIANTMLMAIYERTREIGVLKALGASNADVLRLFVVEAAAIGLLGGVAGLIAGWALGRLLDWAAHQYLIGQQVIIPGPFFLLTPALIAGTLAFATLVGLLAGLYPAARAARLDPVAALRHE